MGGRKGDMCLAPITQTTLSHISTQTTKQEQEEAKAILREIRSLERNETDAIAAADISSFSAAGIFTASARGALSFQEGFDRCDG